MRFPAAAPTFVERCGRLVCDGPYDTEEYETGCHSKSVSSGMHKNAYLEGKHNGQCTQASERRVP